MITKKKKRRLPAETADVYVVRKQFALRGHNCKRSVVGFRHNHQKWVDNDVNPRDFTKHKGDAITTSS